MTDKIDHAGNLTILAEQIDRGVKLNDSGRVRMAADYIRQLEGLVRDINRFMGVGPTHAHTVKQLTERARALGLVEE